MAAAEHLLENTGGTITIEVDGHDARGWTQNQANGMDVWRAGEDMKPIKGHGMVRPVVLRVTGGRIYRPFAVVAGDELPVGIDRLQPCQDRSRNHGSVCGGLLEFWVEAQGVDDLPEGSGTRDGAMVPAGINPGELRGGELNADGRQQVKRHR